MRGTGIALFLLLAAAAPPGSPPSPAPEPLRAPGGWTPQTSGTGNNLNGVAFINSTEGFVVGAANTVLRTVNGGTAWLPQTSSATGALNGVALATTDIGAAVGDGGEILQTQNGLSGSPSTWNLVSSGDFFSVGAYDDTHAFAGNAAAKMRATTDGLAWNAFSSGGTVQTLRGMSFLPGAPEGYWVGDGGVVLKYDGTAWNPVVGNVSTTENLNGVAFVPTSPAGNATGWVVGNMGVIRRTTNSGGSPWASPASGTMDNLNGVATTDNNHAWAVGENSTVVATINGTAWNPQSVPTGGLTLYGVAMIGPSPLKGVIVGSGGNIFSTPDGTNWNTTTWNVGTTPITTAIRGAAMIPTTTRAVAVGDNGVLLLSTNSGSSWSRVSNNLTTENIVAVAFPSTAAGYAVGSKGTILKSTDQGNSWFFQVGGTASSLKDVKFGSTSVGLAVGTAGAILKTTNQGGQWLPKLRPAGGVWLNVDLTSVAFGTSTIAVAVGAGGSVLSTNDAGDTWTNISPGASLSQDLTSVSAISSTLFVATGGGAVAVLNGNATGSSWTVTVQPAPPATIIGLAFPAGSREGYGVAAGGTILASIDAGTSWTSEASGILTLLRAASFPYQGLGWAVGDSGRILKRTIPAAPLLSLPHYIGTPYTWVPPQIDGFLDPELGESRRPDTGWNQSLQVTYGDGTDNPPFTFRGLHDDGAKCLYLAFESRASTTFSIDDAIVILLRGDTGSADYAANDRRIIVYPVPAGGFTGTGHIAEGYIAPTYTSSEYNNPNGSTGGANALKVYARDVASGGWTDLGTAGTIDCKVRSWVDGTSNNCWSVELKIPTDTTSFAQWMTINPDFKLSFYGLRQQTGGVLEFSWPRGLAIAGDADIVDAKMPAFDWGTAKQGTADDGTGVRIKPVSYSNIGVTTPSTPAGTMETTLHGTLENTLHAKVINNATTVAQQVRATFRIADWGVQSGDPSSGAWHLVGANQGTVNPVLPQDIAAISGTTPGEVDFTCKWLMNTTQRADYAGHDHQCIMVTLDSTKDVLFTERSSWTNMNYVPASVFGRKATVSAKGWGMDGARNGAQRFYLHTTSTRFDYAPGKVALDTVPPPAVKRAARSENEKGDHPYYTGENLKRERLALAYRGLADEKTPVSYYRWAIHAVKETSRTVKINGTVHPLLELASGFGYIARHGAEVDQWTSQLSGAIVTKLNDNEYQVDVPANGSGVMDSGLEAKEGGTGGGLFGLILLILLFLILIFWFLKKNP